MSSLVSHPGLVANFCPNCGSRAWSGDQHTVFGQHRFCGDDDSDRFPGACGTQWLATPVQIAREGLLGEDLMLELQRARGLREAEEVEASARIQLLREGLGVIAKQGTSNPAYHAGEALAIDDEIAAWNQAKKATL